MSFHESANNVELEDGHILKATLRVQLEDADEEETEQDSTLDLNYYIGNNDGHFCWGGENFKESASDISFALEGDNKVPVLRAILMSIEGEEIAADINLAERIGNDNGTLIFLKEE